MQKQKVLLRRDETGTFREVAVIESRRGRSLTLAMPDGSVVQHELSEREITPERGSIHHLMRVVPEEVLRTLSSDPARVFKHLLAASSKPLGAKDLKSRLEGLPKDAVDKAWTRARATLVEDEEVERSGADGSRFRLRKDAAPTSLLDLLPAAATQPGRTGTPTPGADEVESRGLDAKSPVDEEPEIQQVVPDGDLVQRLRDVAPDLGDTLQRLVSRPLALGRTVRALSAAEGARLVDGLDKQAMDALVVAAGRIPGHPAKATKEPLPETLAAALNVALDEAADERPETAGPSLAHLSDRAIRAGAVPVSSVLRATLLLARKPVQEAALDTCLRAVADAVDDHGGPHRDWDLLPLARAASKVPLDRDGGRSLLVSRLHKHAPDEARHERWWSGVTVAQLADAGRGRLAGVLEDPAIAEQHVAPAVHELASQVESRRGLATLWGLPPALAVHLTPSRMAEVVGGVAKRDDLTAAWLEEIANGRLVRRLERDVEEARAESQRARDSEAAKARESTRLSAAVDSLTRELEAVRAADTSDRRAHERQLRIDLVRSLAVLVAQVLQSEQARADTALVRQVEFAARREGLEPMAAPGDEVAYDPEQHDLLEPGLSPGSAAAVVRGGFTWHDGEHTVVLVRVQVVPVSRGRS